MTTTPTISEDADLLDNQVDTAGDVPMEESTEQASKHPYGEWNELLPDELQEVLKKLAQKFCDEFRYPRRLEVMKAWQARSFWRELQHLNWNWENECWDVLGPAGIKSGTEANKADSAVLYSTNIFQGFGESYIAIITQSVPSVRFEPEDPEDAADIETAKAADNYKKLIQHENDPVKLMTKAAYYSWTDGRMHGWTRWETDKRTGKPRETQSIEGVMEVKVPVIYESMCEYPYVQFSQEYHVSTVRAKVMSRKFPPDYYKKIKGGSTGNGQDVYERTARISVKQGISMRSAGGDTFASLITTQRTWMRPTVFVDDTVEEKHQDELKTIFPTGCYLEVDNGTYTGSREANMDDEWAIENVMEGDGSFRNAKGTCLVSIQERVNDTINIAQDVYEKTQPASHWDDKIFDIEGMNEQGSMPGARYGVDLSEVPMEVALATRVFFEPAATVSQDMLLYLKQLMTDVPEFLTGISAILFGSDSQGDKSGKALSIQQSAAMGRIGLPFRVMKRLYARMMEQAVRCASRNRQSDISIGIPDENGQLETVQFRVGDLEGNVRCYPDSDENYPESWVSKRATYMQLLIEANADPTMKAILANPKNQVLAKKLIGLQEMEIPDADSWNKQLAEIAILLVEPPPPPPAPVQVPNPLTGDIETIQPPQQSSVPVDPEWDNHPAEIMTISIWLNGEKGQKAKRTNPEGVQNVKLHGEQHKLAMKQEMLKNPRPAPPAAAPPAAKPSQPRHPAAPAAATPLSGPV